MHSDRICLITLMIVWLSAIQLLHPLQLSSIIFKASPNQKLANLSQRPPMQGTSIPQALKSIHMSIPREYLMADQERLSPRLPIPKSPLDQPAISKMICTFPDCVVQGDSGANRALTNDYTLLVAFTAIAPFSIGTIGPKPIMTTHQGIMKVPTVEGLHEGSTTYYSTAASGSVISPDPHVSESKGRLQR